MHDENSYQGKFVLWLGLKAFPKRVSESALMISSVETRRVFTQEANTNVNLPVTLIISARAEHIISLFFLAAYNETKRAFGVLIF